MKKKRLAEKKFFKKIIDAKKAKKNKEGKVINKLRVPIEIKPKVEKSKMFLEMFGIKIFIINPGKFALTVLGITFIFIFLLILVIKLV